MQRAVWLNSVLWTAGQALTSGAFLTYFANDLGATGLQLSLLAAMPELVGISGVGSRSAWRISGGRRAAWTLSTVLARLLTLGIPWLGSPVLTATGWDPVWCLLSVVAFAQMFQGLATNLYFAWLAELVEPASRGTFFARRNIAVLFVQMTVPVLGATLRDTWKSSLPKESLWQAYALVFAIGVGLLLLSVVPMFWVPDPVRAATLRSSTATSLRQVIERPNIRWLLLHNWCLALANGLTQAVFLKYQIQVVSLSLTGYFLLADLMYGLQIVSSLMAGRCRTSADHRRALFRGSLIASCALPFWLIAGYGGWWWLVGAFTCWGAFGAVNVAGPNLLFAISSEETYPEGLVLFRQLAGTLAGLSGILGGLLLDRLSSVPGGQAPAMWPFHVLFLVSWLGRILAALLVLMVLPRHESVTAMTGDGGKTRSDATVTA